MPLEILVPCTPKGIVKLLTHHGDPVMRQQLDYALGNTRPVYTQGHSQAVDALRGPRGWAACSHHQSYNPSWETIGESVSKPRCDRDGLPFEDRKPRRDYADSGYSGQCCWKGRVSDLSRAYQGWGHCGGCGVDPSRGKVARRRGL